MCPPKQPSPAPLSLKGALLLVAAAPAAWALSAVVSVIPAVVLVILGACAAGSVVTVRAAQAGRVRPGPVPVRGPRPRVHRQPAIGGARAALEAPKVRSGVVLSAAEYERMKAPPGRPAGPLAAAAFPPGPGDGQGEQQDGRQAEQHRKGPSG